MSTDDYRAGWLACRQAAAKFVAEQRGGFTRNEVDLLHALARELSALEPAEPMNVVQLQPPGQAGHTSAVGASARGGPAGFAAAPEDAEDVHSPAFYRVGQTGVELVSPFTDAGYDHQLCPHDMLLADNCVTCLQRMYSELHHLRLQLEQKVTGLAAELTAAQVDRDEARRQLRAAKAGVGDVWRWQPDGGNAVETMSASLAVVMTADTLLDFVAVRQALEERGCERGRTVDACLSSRNPCATCSALGACPV